MLNRVKSTKKYHNISAVGLKFIPITAGIKKYHQEKEEKV